MAYFILIIVLTLLQALLLNHIVLFGVAMPLFFVYFVLQTERGFPRWMGMLMAFAQGLAVDMFSNTPGMAAGAMTLTAFVQPYLLELFMENDNAPDLKPHLQTMGFMKYFTYALILVLLFSLAYFTLEAFSFFDIIHWLECIGGSTLLTLVMIIVIDSVRR